VTMPKTRVPCSGLRLRVPGESVIAESEKPLKVLDKFCEVVWRNPVLVAIKAMTWCNLPLDENRLSRMIKERGSWYLIHHSHVCDRVADVW